MAPHVADPSSNRVVFLVNTGLLHPYFRVRAVESALHDRVKVPTVLFYPDAGRDSTGCTSWDITSGRKLSLHADWRPGMSTIRELFSTTRPIDRPIEKS